MGEKFEFDGLPEAMKLEVLNRLSIQAKARIMLFSDCYRLLEDHMSTTIEKMKDPEERRKYSSNLEFVRKQSRYLIDKMLEGETVAVALHRWKKAGIFLVWIPFGQTQSRLSVILELGPKGILNFTKKDLLELLQPLFDCPLPSIPIVPLPLKSSGRPTESASAPPKGLGVKLGKRQRANQLLESLKAEGELIVEDVRPSIGQSKPATSPPSDPVTLTVEENINVTLKQDGGIENFHVQGTLSLHIRQDDGLIQIQIETGRNPGIQFRTPPNINKELFSGENILGLKDPNHPFPIGQAGDGVSLLKWRMHSADESLVPLSINCWPAVSANETSVTLEYKAPPLFDLQNVVISIPVPALREAPNVRQIDGDWRYDSRRSILEWYILLIDKSNRSGSMDFVIPAAVHTSDLFPIYVRFTSARTFSDVKVVKILPLKGGNPPKFSQSTLLSTGNYQLV